MYFFGLVLVVISSGFSLYLLLYGEHMLQARFRKVDSASDSESQELVPSMPHQISLCFNINLSFFTQTQISENTRNDPPEPEILAICVRIISHHGSLSYQKYQRQTNITRTMHAVHGLLFEYLLKRKII